MVGHSERGGRAMKVVGFHDLDRSGRQSGLVQSGNAVTARCVTMLLIRSSAWHVGLLSLLYHLPSAFSTMPPTVTRNRPLGSLHLRSLLSNSTKVAAPAKETIALRPADSICRALHSERLFG